MRRPPIAARGLVPARPHFGLPPDNTMRTRLSLVCFMTLSVACSSPGERARDRARADSAVALAAPPRLLMDKLTSQRDSVSRVLGDANMFIGRIDSSISRVKGLAANSTPKRNSESGLEDQLRARKDMRSKEQTSELQSQ